MSGWEPAVVTEYEYDDSGRLLASVASREPEWSDADRESLIAYLEAQRVGPHGHPMDVATSRSGDPANPNREWDWVVPSPTLDHAASALEREKATYRKSYPNADMSALLWRVEQRRR